MTAAFINAYHDDKAHVAPCTATRRRRRVGAGGSPKPLTSRSSWPMVTLIEWRATAFTQGELVLDRRSHDMIERRVPASR